MKEPGIPILTEGQALRERFNRSPAILKESLSAYVSRNYAVIERELNSGRTTAQLAADIAAVRKENVSVTNVRTYLSKLRKKFPNVRADLKNRRFADARSDDHQGAPRDMGQLPPPALSKASASVSPPSAEIADNHPAPRPAAKTYPTLK